MQCLNKSYYYYIDIIKYFWETIFAFVFEMIYLIYLKYNDKLGL